MLSMSKKKAAPKKPGRPRTPDSIAMTSLGIRCTEAWKQWLQDYANSRRKVMADLIDEAIEEHAEKRGYKPPPPKR
jgi:hypothetical protein